MPMLSRTCVSFFAAVLIFFNALAPAQLLVYCVGEDGHAGIEFAHDAGACAKASCAPSIHETDTCCPSEEDSGAAAISEGLACCESRSCEDTSVAFTSALVAPVQNHKSYGVFAIAVIPGTVSFMGETQKLFAPLRIPKHISPHIRSTVLRV